MALQQLRLLLTAAILCRLVGADSPPKHGEYSQACLGSQCSCSREAATLTRADWSPSAVLFVLIDDLGYADVGYHSNDVSTPNIDYLVKDLKQIY